MDNVDWTPYVAAWVFCGLICVVIAQSKGGEPLPAFLLGVLLGPIGILVALLSSGAPKIERVRTYANHDEYTADFQAAQRNGWRVERERSKDGSIEVTYRK